MQKHPNDRTVKLSPVVPIASFSHFNSIRASKVEIKKQTWLWDGYIPLKTSTLFAGAGGIGKSTLLSFIISAVTNGSTFKVNGIEYTIPQGNVILLSAEDSVERSIVPRLIIDGANLDNIEIIKSTSDSQASNIERFVALDTDMHLLEAKVKEIGNVKLIVIDPISAYIGNLRDDKAPQVRNFVLKLNKIANEYDLANILNAHTRKKDTKGNSSGSAADEVMGSSAWTSTARQNFSITRHHDDDELIVFANSKNNICKKAETLSYRIEIAELKHNDEVISISKINWQAGKMDMSAEEAVHQEMYEKKLDTEVAKEFILNQLSFGSKTAEEMNRRAIEAGINPRTLKNARQQLGREGTPIIMEPGQLDKRKMIWYIGTVQNNSDI